ncbi:cytochrome c oxidase subunit II [Fodinisporobacter ferrooxydans]|uniref:Cytochrome c oxidase subunit 2 n=1 Tax=Fodinisporobacter ferrooxydans TaxID=2901836 RepID=A0ABY4CH43_9BACL|nr:cytochrome c oxidase subunit II [Alicyclobacillaceae bacterium MYW30-H2]
MIDYIIFGILWVILSLLGEWGVQSIGDHLYLSVASAQAHEGQEAAAFILSILTPIFVFVVLMLLFILFRYRNKSSDSSHAKLQVKNNKPYIAIWVAVSILINVLLFIHPTDSAIQTMFMDEESQAKSAPNVLVVDVVARQWEWQYSYPQYGLTQTVDKDGNDQIVLPVNTKIEFVLRSYDPAHTYDPAIGVIHSFWVPAFGIKEDVIPGETRTEYITTTKITNTKIDPMVRVQCAEVCGAGHPYMETPLSIVSGSDFQKWIAKEKKMQQGS